MSVRFDMAIDNLPIVREIKKRRFNALVRRRGTVYVQKKHVPTFKVSKAKARTNKLMQEISAVWKLLTFEQKAMWEAYFMDPLVLSNSWLAFYKNNMQNVYPLITGKTWVTNITAPGVVPETPVLLTAVYYANTDSVRLHWEDPYPANYYVQSFFYNVPGRHRRYPPSWKYFSWANSKDLTMDIPGIELIPGRIALFTIRILNPRGEVSAFAKQKEEKLPEPPDPKFTAFPRKGLPPHTVHFEDLSSGYIWGYEWFFGDGGGSTEQNPSHTYEQVGQYHVTLVLLGTCESRTTRKYSRYIEVLTYDPPSPYCYPIIVNNYSNKNELTNFQVKLTIDANDAVFLHGDDNGANWRFYGNDHETLLDYFIAKYHNGKVTEVWIKVDLIEAKSTKNIYLYVMEGSPASASDPDATFLLYDSFPGDTLDTEKWITRQGSIGVSGGNLELINTAGTRGLIESIKTFSPPIIQECRMSTSNPYPDDFYPGFLREPDSMYNWAGYHMDSWLHDMWIYTVKNGDQRKTTQIYFPTWGNLQTYKNIWTSEKFECLVDDVSQVTHITKIPTADMCSAFYEGPRPTIEKKIYVHWIRVRKHADPEPEITLTSPYYYPITIDNTAGAVDLTDYQIKLTIPSNSDVYDHVDEDGNNVRFYDSDHDTLLSFWFESWNYNGDSIVWIKVPEINAGSTKSIHLYVRYGYHSNVSNADNTFLFYDNFPGDDLDTDKWETCQGEIGIGSGELILEGTTGTRGLIESKTTIVAPIIMECRIISFDSPMWDMYPGFLRKSGDWDNWAGYYTEVEDNETTHITRASATETKTEDVLLPGWDTTRVYKLVLTSAKYELLVDDVLKVTHNTHIPSGALNAAFYGGSQDGKTMYVNWIRIRKHTDPEPIISFT